MHKNVHKQKAAQTKHEKHSKMTPTKKETETGGIFEQIIQ